MEYDLEIEKVVIKLPHNFNLLSVKKIKNIITNENYIEELVFDLKKSNFVDSEAIIYLYKLSETKKITILNPPKILNKVLNILNIEKQFKSSIKIGL